MGKSTFCKPKLSKRRKWFDCAIFMGPSILMFTVLFLIPLGGELLYSFTDWNGVDPTFSFNGVTNYFKTFAEPEYWASLWFTIKFSFFVVIFSNLLAFGWAYILSKDIPLRNLWRALIYVPRIIGGVILGFLWRFIFQNVFVQFGKWTGWSWFSQNWFTTPSSSFWALVIVMTWTLSGYLMIIYGAGFSAIDSSYIEAATIDGASKRQILFRITRDEKSRTFSSNSQTSYILLNLVAKQTLDFVLHCLSGVLVEVDTDDIGRAVYLLSDGGCGVLGGGLCCCVSVFCHSIPPVNEKCPTRKG